MNYWDLFIFKLLGNAQAEASFIIAQWNFIGGLNGSSRNCKIYP